MDEQSDWDLQYSEAKLREFIEDAVARKGTRNRPRYYVVTGSHVYGFESEGSDIDVRGFHVTPAAEYAYLAEPQSEVTVNMDGTTEGFEHMPEVDLRSYELKQFGSLLYQANYNVVETVLCAPAVMNGVSLEIEALGELIREYLPMNVPNAYFGMARSNYYKHLDPEKSDSYDPRPKKFLYVYRGLLGAQYVQDHGDVEADVLSLSEAVDAGDPELVADLIAVKRDAGVETTPAELEERARDAIRRLFNEVDPPSKPDKSGYREAIDGWMRKVRL